jgi:hypothetical protein
VVTFNPPVLIGTNMYRVTWSSDQVAPVYTIRVAGEIVSVQSVAEWTMPGGAVLDVQDVAGGTPADAHPPYLDLYWLPVSDAVKYRIEEDTGSSTWVARKTIAADPSRSFYVHRTGTLADETTHAWRVVPIDAAGNDGTPATFSALMVRNPDVPDQEFAYDAGTGVVTVGS